MEVIANGETIGLPDDARVPDLLEALGVRAKWVLVELNGVPVERSNMDSTSLRAGDRVELVRAVAGG